MTCFTAPATRRHLVLLLLIATGTSAALTHVPTAQAYQTFLDGNEDQTPQGVRGADGDAVLLACSYTLSGSATQGMWWKGSLTTGSGIAYKVLPSIGAQTVTSSLYYGPNTPEFDPSLGAGTIRIVGSYQYVGSTQDNNGLLYTGPLSGTGGTWTQINVPNASVSGTVANTIPHSVMGSIVVGNYNLVVDGTSARLGNAFLYNISNTNWTIFDAPFGGTNKLTSAYGVWQNGIGSTSYTIAGGSSDAGIDKAYLVDYDSATNTFSNLTYFYDGAIPGLTHFEGITGTPDGYNLIGITGTGYSFASVRRNVDQSFGTAIWSGPLSYPNSTMTTGNTVIGDQAIGIYTLSGSTNFYAYVATVPEPSTAAVAALGAALTGLLAWRGGRRRSLAIMVAVGMLSPVASAATLHVSPAGDDAAAGTGAAPLASVQAAVVRTAPGDTIILHDGVFDCDRTILLSGTGTAAAPFRLRAADGASPVLDFAGFAPADEKTRATARGIFLPGDHWVIEGLEIRNAPDNGLKIEGSHNRVERCVFHHNGDSGLQIGLAKKSHNDGAFAAHNTVVNCDSYRNFDARTKGENADGFACKLYPGPGNSFVGCRAWENADDGWDLFMTTFPVTLDRCWAWRNGNPELFTVKGSYNGDGNGFKLGGQDRPAGHLVRRCIAFDHPFGSGNGFEDNNNTAAITVQHCTAWGNRTNFQFKKAAHVLENCASFAPTKSKSGVEFDADVVCRGNSWMPDPNPKKKGKYVSTLAAAAFTGLDPALAAGAREANGDLPRNGYAAPVAGGAVIDSGLDLGEPFVGAAPDQGAVEFGAGH